MSQHTKSKQSGQSAVEFALVIPMLLAMLLWLISIGFQFHSYAIVANATRAAARHAAIHGVDEIFDDAVTAALAPIVPPNPNFCITGVTIKWVIGDYEYDSLEAASASKGPEAAEGSWVRAIIMYPYDPIFSFAIIQALLFAQPDEPVQLYLSNSAIFKNERFID